jgi:hypothetical protein
MTIQHWRHLWKSAPKLEPGLEIFGIACRYEFYWDIIRNDSFVIVTAAEAGIGHQVPTRVMALARPITVGNIAAHDGFVEFCLWWHGDYSRLPIWTDITVFDRNDPSGAN